MIEPVKITVGSNVNWDGTEYTVMYISKNLVVLRGSSGLDYAVDDSDWDNITIPVEFVVPE